MVPVVTRNQCLLRDDPSSPVRDTNLRPECGSSLKRLLIVGCQRRDLGTSWIACGANSYSAMSIPNFHVSTICHARGETPSSIVACSATVECKRKRLVNNNKYEVRHSQRTLRRERQAFIASKEPLSPRKGVVLRTFSGSDPQKEDEIEYAGN